jgi:hypothetical protein
MGMWDGGDAAKNNARKANKDQKKATKKANKKVKQGERKAVGALNEGKTAARTDLTTAKTEALPKLTEGRDLGNTELRQGRDTGIATSREGLGTARNDFLTAKNEGLGFLEGGANRARDAYGSARGMYQPLLDAANRGAGMYGDFFGMGGQEGFGRAQNNWQSSPLYQAMVGTGSLGMQALDRQANARGNPYNGTDVIDYQQKLAGQYMGDYIGGLRPYLDQQGQYADDMASTYNQQAAMETGLGQNQAQVADTAGSRLGAAELGTAADISNTQVGTGQDLSGNYMNTGQNQSNVITGTGANLANVETGTAQNLSGVYTGQNNLQAANLMAQGQNDADMYANITAAGNVANQNKMAMINAGIQAAGSLGGAALGRPKVA